MIPYYLKLATTDLLRNKISALMLVITLALGIGASMTMLTLVHVITRDPAPTLSNKLFYPVIDAAPIGWDGTPGDNFTWFDAMNLVRANAADAQAAMAGGRALVTPGGSLSGRPFYANGHLVTSQFFKLFDVQFNEGHSWSAQDDDDHVPVIVLNGDFARQLFGQSSPLGKTVRLDKTDYQVVGVINDWHPQPLFYGGLSGDYAFGQGDEYFIPLTTGLERKVRVLGGMTCWSDTDDPRKGDSCGWLQVWIRLDTPEKVTHFEQFLRAYWQDQQKNGRLLRQVPPQLNSMMTRLKSLHLVPDDVKRQLVLALGFLVVCMLNVVGLLIAKFLRMSPQISVRRALGAKKSDIVYQLTCQSALVGVLGGVLGCFFTYVGVSLIRSQPDHYAQLAQIDMGNLFATLLLAVCCALGSSLVPAYRASRVAPALELKINE